MDRPLHERPGMHHPVARVAVSSAGSLTVRVRLKRLWLCQTRRSCSVVSTKAMTLLALPCTRRSRGLCIVPGAVGKPAVRCRSRGAVVSQRRFCPIWKRSSSRPPRSTTCAVKLSKAPALKPDVTSLACPLPRWSVRQPSLFTGASRSRCPDATEVSFVVHVLDR